MLHGALWAVWVIENFSGDVIRYYCQAPIVPSWQHIWWRTFYSECGAIRSRISRTENQRLCWQFMEHRLNCVQKFSAAVSLNWRVSRSTVHEVNVNRSAVSPIHFDGRQHSIIRIYSDGHHSTFQHGTLIGWCNRALLSFCPFCNNFLRSKLLTQRRTRARS